MKIDEQREALEKEIEEIILATPWGMLRVAIYAALTKAGAVLKVADPPVLPLREVMPGDIGASQKLQDRQWKAIKEAKRQGCAFTAPLIEKK